MVHSLLLFILLLVEQIIYGDVNVPVPVTSDCEKQIQAHKYAQIYTHIFTHTKATHILTYTMIYKSLCMKIEGFVSPGIY